MTKPKKNTGGNKKKPSGRNSAAGSATAAASRKLLAAPHPKEQPRTHLAGLRCRVVIASSGTISSEECRQLGSVVSIGTDIGSIASHMNDIQAADITIFVDDGRLFDLPDTDRAIRNCLGQLSLVTQADIAAIEKKYPEPFEEEPLLDPAGYAAELMTYDFRQDLMGRTSKGERVWLGTKDCEDPVLQRNHLTAAVAKVVCQCFAAGQAEVEQHGWVLLGSGDRPFRSDLLDLLLGKQRADPGRSSSQRPPHTTIEGLCHSLGCRASSRFRRLPGKDGVLLRQLGRPCRVTPLRTDTGAVCGFFASAKRQRMAWLDTGNGPRSNRDTLSVCLRQFGITWPPPRCSRDAAIVGAALRFTTERRPQRSHQPGWIISYTSGATMTDVEMGHRAFLLLLAHAVSALRGERGIDLMSPRIAGRDIAGCYKPRSRKSRAKPAQQIHLCFTRAGISHAIIRPVESDPAQTSRAQYTLALSPERVDLSALCGCGDPDVEGLLSLLPPRN